MASSADRVRFVGGSEVWPALTALMTSARHRHVAIAYVSSADLLPLRRGDRLVVDAGLDRIAAGATDPRALLKWIRLGVEVWSRPDLHAKVIVTDTHAAIGSANASVNSADHLQEAVLLTDEVDVRRAASQLLRRWIDEADLLTADEVAKLIPLFGTERLAGRPTGWDTIVPRPLQRLMFISTALTATWPADVEHTQQAMENRTPAADRLELEWVECDRADEFARGHLVCQIQQGVGVWGPQQVIYVLEVRRRKWLLLLTDPDLGATTRAALYQDSGVPARINVWIHDPVQIRAVLAHWGLEG